MGALVIGERGLLKHCCLPGEGRRETLFKPLRTAIVFSFCAGKGKDAALGDSQ